jgi:single-strand DNA-binding protein
MNVFSFTGNLGKDCRKGTGSTAVVNFGVGVKSGFGDKAQTIWIDCALWGKQAESKLSDYLLKGQQVAVSGELGTREHDGKTYLTCRVNSIDLVGGKRDESAQQQPRPAQNQQGANGPDSFEDTDIPFAPLHFLA